MKLKKLLVDLEYELLQGTLDQEVSQIDYDSRQVTRDSLFVCIEGSQVDGHVYVDQVIKTGAKTLVVTKNVDMREGITYIKVKDARYMLALLSCAYFHHPSRQLTVIGVTGTKGKTTTTYMLKSILETAHKKVGIIGTIGSMINGQFEKTMNTTPESFELQRLMHRMVEAGCEYCVMEVSSQGLMLNRVAGIDFDFGIFTNLSPDHIGPYEHDSFEHYMACKKQLFQMCKIGIFNQDDEHFEDMTTDISCQVYTYSLHHNSDIQATDIDLYKGNGHLGVHFTTQGLVNGKFDLDMPGYFNVYNAMVSILIAHFQNIPDEFIHMALPHVRVLGRAEIIPVSKDYTVMIDFAHNPISTQSILETIRAYSPKRIVCIYGSVGDRTQGRRKDIGEVVGRLADFSILTADNPGFESVHHINLDIIEGLNQHHGQYVEIDDRQEAIEYSLAHAQKGDVIMILGKGHEDYQLIGKERLPLDEKAIIADFIAKQIVSV